MSLNESAKRSVLETDRCVERNDDLRGVGELGGPIQIDRVAESGADPVRVRVRVGRT